MPKGILIIGLGQIGMEYDIHIPADHVVFTHAKAFSIHPDFELLGAVDPSKEKRSRFSENYHKPAFTDLTEAFQNIDPQIIIIASPTIYHKVILEEVLNLSKPLAVLCEKPLSYCISDARSMIELCEQMGVRLFVNYMRRSDPGVVEIRDRIHNGSIEAPIKGVAWYSKGFLHNGSHFFNLLEFWLGKYQRSTVMSNGRLWQDQDPEPDIYVEFERGNITFIAAWEEAFSHYTIELLSPSGRLRYEKGGEYIAWQSTQPDPNFSGYTILNGQPEIIGNSMDRYQWYVADQLARALAGQAASICSGREGLTTLENMNQIINFKQS
jgi:predicted dehydrogenase